MSSTPIHGNYRGYYTKRPAAAYDPRLALLPLGTLKGKRVLDVGCNEGWITCEVVIITLWTHRWHGCLRAPLALRYGAVEVVGVDIDDALVRAAWKRRRTVWSQYARDPSSESMQVGNPLPPHIRPQSDAFPAAFEHMFGPLPIPPVEDLKTNEISPLSTCRTSSVSGISKDITRTELPHGVQVEADSVLSSSLGSGQSSHKHNSAARFFPHNVIFRTADWVRDGVLDDREGWDVILAFSITKWIHLNEGDEGIRKLFQRAFETLRTGGVLVVEPQEWETYAKARRMDARLKENAQKLQLRPADFEHVLLQEVGFRSVEHLGFTGKGGFSRPLDLYRK